MQTWLVDYERKKKPYEWTENMNLTNNAVTMESTKLSAYDNHIAHAIKTISTVFMCIVDANEVLFYLFFLFF